MTSSQSQADNTPAPGKSTTKHRAIAFSCWFATAALSTLAYSGILESFMTVPEIAPWGTVTAAVAAVLLSFEVYYWTRLLRASPTADATTTPLLKWLVIMPLTTLPAAAVPAFPAAISKWLLFLFPISLFVVPLIQPASTGIVRLIRAPIGQGHLGRVWVLILLDVSVAVTVTACVALGATADLAGNEPGNLQLATRLLLLVVVAREWFRLRLMYIPQYHDEAEVQRWSVRLIWAAVPVLLYIAAATFVGRVFPSEPASTNAFLVLSCLLVATQGLNAIYLPNVPRISASPKALTQPQKDSISHSLRKMRNTVALSVAFAILIP